MKRRIAAACVILSLVAVFVYCAVAKIARWQVATAQKQPDLPRIEISLNGVTYQDIKDNGRSIRYSGNTLRLSDGEENWEFQDVEIKGRGNSTWGADKKPLQVKLPQKFSVLGMPAEKKWVLLANIFDESLLRNDLALTMSEWLGEQYLKSGKFVNLSIDGEDQGLYYIVSKVEIEKTRVNLRDPLGILVELDNLYAGENHYEAVDGSKLTVSDLVADDNEKAAMKDFLDSFNKLYLAAENGDFAIVQEVADVKSLVRYYLLSEFTSNPDAYSTSYYFYKDGPEDKIHAGPGWDFDYAFGNRNWEWGRADFHSPFLFQAREVEAFGGEERNVLTGAMVEYERLPIISRLFYYLARMPEFRSEVRATFDQTLRGRCDELLAIIEQRSDLIRESALMDGEIWHKNGYDEAVAELAEWIRLRYGYFEYLYSPDEAK